MSLLLYYVVLMSYYVHNRFAFFNFVCAEYICIWYAVFNSVDGHLFKNERDVLTKK